MDALAKGDTRSMDLLFVVRNEEDFFWLREFRELEKRFPNFHLHLSLTQPKDGWQGLSGRVQQALPLVVNVVQKNMSDFLLYACGNPDMTKEVKALAIGPWGMAKERVHIEGYI
jgi:NAD(P)H-flavin reductase